MILVTVYYAYWQFRVQQVLGLGLGLMSLVGLGLRLDSSLRNDQVSSLIFVIQQKLEKITLCLGLISSQHFQHLIL